MHAVPSAPWAGGARARAVTSRRRGPRVSYFYVAGEVVRVHAACDAVWMQEHSGAGRMSP